MKETEGFEYHEFDTAANLDDSGVVSATEATGMMPIPPQSNAQREAYQELGSIVMPKSAPAKQRNTQKRHANRDNNRPVL